MPIKVLITVLTITMSSNAWAATTSDNQQAPDALPQAEVAITSATQADGTPGANQYLQHHLDLLELKFEQLKDNTDTKLARVDDFHNFGTWVSIAMGLLAIFIAVSVGLSSVAAYFVTKSKTKEQVDKWLEEYKSDFLSSKKEFDQYVSTASMGCDYLREITLSTMSSASDLDAQDNYLLNLAADRALETAENNRTFTDWCALALRHYFRDNFTKSINAWNVALSHSEIRRNDEAWAIGSKGAAIMCQHKYDEAVTIFSDVINNFEKSSKTEVLKHVSKAFARRSFSRLCLAKQHWAEKEKATDLLNSALQDSIKALEIEPSYPLATANQAYTLFLLDEDLEEIETLLHEALKWGGKNVLNIELVDIEINQIDERDEQFRELLMKVWGQL